MDLDELLKYALKFQRPFHADRYVFHQYLNVSQVQTMR